MTTAPAGIIRLCRLYERTSARGNRYLLGRLGYARLIAFQGEPTAEGTPTWDVFISPGDPEAARRPAGVPEKSEPAPAASGRPPRPRSCCYGRPAGAAGQAGAGRGGGRRRRRLRLGEGRGASLLTRSGLTC